MKWGFVSPSATEPSLAPINPPLRQMLREVVGRALGHHTVPDTRIVRVLQAHR
jgi:hypothetical protein